MQAQLFITEKLQFSRGFHAYIVNKQKDTMQLFRA